MVAGVDHDVYRGVVSLRKILYPHHLVHSGKSGTIREWNQASGVRKVHCA